jgi:hypothetical protein
MNTRMAMSDLLEIRRNLAMVGSFRGYKAIPVAFTGLVAFAAGLTQYWIQPEPMQFVLLWTLAAALGFGVNLLCIARQYGTTTRRWERSLAVVALSDVSPAFLAGGLLTVAMCATGHVQLLPGLWMALFGTGILSSRRHLSLSCTLMGGGYLLAGTATLFYLQGGQALEAWVMSLVFGLGQILFAVLLARTSP